MKRLWFALAILAIILAATLYSGRYLTGITHELSSLLVQAQTAAEADHWEESGHITQKALDRWEAHNMYLYTMLRHSDTDAVSTGFHEVREFIRLRERGEYSAANARLLAEIQRLCEMEQLSLRNLL